MQLDGALFYKFKFLIWENVVEFKFYHVEMLVLGAIYDWFLQNLVL